MGQGAALIAGPRPPVAEVEEVPTKICEPATAVGSLQACQEALSPRAVLPDVGAEVVRCVEGKAKLQVRAGHLDVRSPAEGAPLGRH